MTLELQILAAFGLDLLVGDPRWLPHPVKGIYKLATAMEPAARRLLRNERLAGVVTALLVYAVAGGAAWGLIVAAGLLHPLAGDVVGALVIYTTIAARDLTRHSMAVYRPLRSGDLTEARRRVGWIVGRDTKQLDEAGVTRAAVESVAESTVDGVTAPIFYAAMFGPVGAMVYRAINTLDSTFGYRNERYARFGWASARIDDLANLLPARLTAVVMVLAAAIVQRRPLATARVILRDARNHQSPNAGFPESAMAGALAVQLGGVNYYDGEPLAKPTLGDAAGPLSATHIVRANIMMYVTAGLFLLLCLGARLGIETLWHAWRGGA